MMPDNKSPADDEITAFMSTRPKAVSKLDPWSETIHSLLVQGATYRDIAAFLAQKGVAVGPSHISQYVKRRKRQDVFGTVSRRRQAGIGAAEPAVVLTAGEVAPVAAPEGHGSEDSRPEGLPKFEWDLSKKPKVEW